MLCLVVFGESDVDVLHVACLNADELLFKARNERVAAKFEVVIFCAAALEFLAVYATDEVDGDGVAVCGCRVDVDKTRLLFLLLSNLFVNLLLGDFHRFLCNRKSFILTKRNFGFDNHNDGILHTAVFRHVNVANAVYCYEFVVGTLFEFGQRRIDEFVDGVAEEYALSVHTLDDLLGCVTFSKTGNCIFVLGFLVGLLDCRVESVLVNNIVEFNLAFFQLFCCVVHLSSIPHDTKNERIYIFLTSERDYNTPKLKNQ